MAQRLRGEHDAVALSSPELTLLEMLYEGLTNKEMAQRLQLAEITVKSRLARLCRRFGVRTRVQMLSIAIRRDLIRRHG
jgi:two-component system response regulator DevR